MQLTCVPIVRLNMSINFGHTLDAQDQALTTSEKSTYYVHRTFFEQVYKIMDQKINPISRIGARFGVPL